MDCTFGNKNGWFGCLWWCSGGDMVVSGGGEGGFDGVCVCLGF